MFTDLIIKLTSKTPKLNLSKMSTTKYVVIIYTDLFGNYLQVFM